MAQAQQPFSCVTFATSGDALVTDVSSMALMLSSSHLCQILQPGAIQMIHQQLREPEKSAGLKAFALLHICQLLKLEGGMHLSDPAHNSAHKVIDAATVVRNII